MSLVTEISFIDDNKAKDISNYEMHDHLTEEADWNAQYWDFDLEYLHEYSKVLEGLFNDSKNGFEFQSIWIGEVAKNVINLKINEFLDVVTSNKIGTSIRYIIRK